MNETFLGFDWNPFLFFVVLLITMGIAFFLRRFPVLWLLSAIVLYSGLNWGFPFDNMYKFIFVVMVLVGLVAGLVVNRWGRGRAFPKYPLYMMAIMLLLLGCALIFSGDWHVSEEDARTAASETTEYVPDGDNEDFEYDLNPDVTGPVEPTDSPTITPSATPTPTPTATATATGAETVTANPDTEQERDDEDGESAEVRQYTGQQPSIPDGTCLGLLGWDTLVDCVEDNNLQWYIDGVNARAGETGFDWSDAVQWAEARTPDGDFPEVRYIQVFGDDVSDAEAIDWAQSQVGKQLHVVRQPACFDNTEGIPGGKLKNFRYCPQPERQMRIALMPLLLDGDGNATGALNTGSGVFVDCLNVWWSVLYGK